MVSQKTLNSSKVHIKWLQKKRENKNWGKKTNEIKTNTMTNKLIWNKLILVTYIHIYIHNMYAYITKVNSFQLFFVVVEANGLQKVYILTCTDKLKHFLKYMFLHIFILYQ